ncbi:MAG: hypothetical protein J7K90_02620 [Desulfuromusa sp.]|nr:hypothetical protein [Desulfuromusa sp.]
MAWTKDRFPHAEKFVLLGTVSHDRHFLRSLVDRVFEIDHGAMIPYEGDYE